MPAWTVLRFGWCAALHCCRRRTRARFGVRRIAPPGSNWLLDLPWLQWTGIPPLPDAFGFKPEKLTTAKQTLERILPLRDDRNSTASSSRIICMTGPPRLATFWMHFNRAGADL